VNSRGRRFLIFTLRGKQYSVNAGDLSEVMETAATFPIPRAPRCYLGVMNFHGVPTPVLDLASFLFGDPPTGPGNLLVLDHRFGSLALRIDTVVRIVSDIRDLRIQPDEGAFVRHSILFHNERIPVLALDMLVDELEEEARTGRPGNGGIGSDKTGRE
jgi:chemotaxis signal transduction protein